jgi:regulator of sigma E protease
MEIFSDVLHNIASFIFIISIIVFIHEYGHYWVAKKCGVMIESFSIGFGPEIKGWNDKSGTRWKISAFPLGGYVKMFGDAGAASTPDGEKVKKMTKAEKEKSFHYKPLWQKALVVVAGPAANFILAIFILSYFFVAHGRAETLPVVEEVMISSAAEKAGFQTGDHIIRLDGTYVDRFEDIRRVAHLNPGIPVEFIITRNGKEITGMITPKKSTTKDIFGNEVTVGLIGITSTQVEYHKMGVTEAVVASVVETYSISRNTLKALGQIVTGQRSSDDISGILRIAKYSGQSTEKGFRVVLWFMAILSINLGLINLFPIPMLDGGHLMFYAIEAASGRPLAEKVQEYGFRVGLVILIALMIFATINDLRYFNVF